MPTDAKNHCVPLKHIARPLWFVVVPWAYLGTQLGNHSSGVRPRLSISDMLILRFNVSKEGLRTMAVGCGPGGK